MYWSDGGQIVPPQDHEIISEVSALNYSDIHFDAKEELIEIIGAEIDEAF